MPQCNKDGVLMNHAEDAMAMQNSPWKSQNPDQIHGSQKLTHTLAASPTTRSSALHSSYNCPSGLATRWNVHAHSQSRSFYQSLQAQNEHCGLRPLDERSMMTDNILFGQNRRDSYCPLQEAPIRHILRHLNTRLMHMGYCISLKQRGLLNLLLSASGNE